MNINSFLSSLKGREVVIKLKIGVIRCVIDEVGNEGSLKVSKIKLVETFRNSLKGWEGRDDVVIRKDSVVAVFIE